MSSLKFFPTCWRAIAFAWQTGFGACTRRSHRKTSGLCFTFHLFSFRFFMFRYCSQSKCFTALAQQWIIISTYWQLHQHATSDSNNCVGLLRAQRSEWEMHSLLLLSSSITAFAQLMNIICFHWRSPCSSYVNWMDLACRGHCPCVKVLKIPVEFIK